MIDDFDLSKVISEEYRTLIENKTKSSPWGNAVIGSVPRIYKYALQHDCKSILDYGSGKSDFINTLNQDFPNHGLQINQYEPARPEFAHDPLTSDMTICVDVLEHIEPDKLDAVLDHIYQKTNKIFYFKVCLVAAHSTFPDGRNLHLIIEDEHFWKNKLSKQYTLTDIITTKFHVWGLAIKNK